MPEIPEIRAHAERLEALAAGEVLKRVEPLSFTAFKTASPPPSDAVGWPLRSVGQRAKYLLLRFAPPPHEPTTGESGLTFVVHLMQGGRLRVLEPGANRPRRPRDGLARFEFDSGLGLMLTEPGTQKRAGVWVLAGDPAGAKPLSGTSFEAIDATSAASVNPLIGLGPEATDVDPASMAELMAAHSARLHNFLRDQRVISGLGRRMANEICHRAKLSPFASTAKLDAEAVGRVVAAIGTVVDESLTAERQLAQMSRSADRPSAVHARTGEPCPACGDVVRAVEYRDYTVNYCAGCQTGGRVLADNTTSKFLR
ncbi:MAG: hypothetical protein OXB99_07555 [Acidimicrobiaceae bacterium]|nr:hypothetical protein [Acidimicrobiaceae bacterium]